MSDSPWSPIDPRRWHEVPHLRGRLGTPDDISEGRALFHLDVEEHSAAPADVGLPCCGLQTLEDGTLRPVVVIQAEAMDGKTILGVRYLPGGGGVCTLEEVRLLNGPEEWLPAKDPGKEG